jgi:hypothetical protein
VLLAVVLAWGLLLTAGGIWYSFHGRPTAREQTTVAEAQPVVDRAIGIVVRAAGPAAVPAVFGFDKVSDCSVTPLRGGVTYERALWLFTPAGGEADLLDRIAQALPERYNAQTHRPVGGGSPTFTADAGLFVAVRGSVPVPGLVVIRAGTGCRTLGHQPAADPTAAPGPDPLGVSGTWRVHTLPCGLRTVAVAGPAARPVSSLPRDGAVVATGDVYADRSGLAARADAGAVTLTTTTGTCR